ncbi:MAG TPA: hypothetical protein VGQ46_04440 [Thermoanaerobaculia bacterium]|jgi:hypothetical protein|nr:hypothetical protein [Thermoanaerobaculia bacterium]
MLSAILALLAMTAAAKLPAVLAHVTTQTLSGERVALPDDLTQPAIFVAGFTKASRSETEAWAHRLRDDARIASKAKVYEVSILDGVPGFLRGMIVSQMRSGIAASRQKQFLIVSEAVDLWKQALDANGGDDHAHVIVVKPSGVIVWRGHGALSDAAYQALISSIE